MKKEITLGTKIIFTATGEKYSIIEQTATGFQFKPIKFEKGLPTVPRTFEEVKDEFLSSQIDIENFEHNDADNRLVELIMDGYIKDSLITEFKTSLSALTNEKNELADKFLELNTLSGTHQATIHIHEATIQDKEKTILAHEATINEQQDAIQERKDFIQGQKDEIESLKSQVSSLKSQVTAFETKVAELESNYSHLNADYTADRENWKSEEEKYKSTIEGLEASMPEKV